MPCEEYPVYFFPFLVIRSACLEAILRGAFLVQRKQIEMPISQNRIFHLDRLYPGQDNTLN